ncbi:MAG TPA: hypothetical protein VGM10_32445 [Actinocrinis sp.]
MSPLRPFRVPFRDMGGRGAEPAGPGNRRPRLSRIAQLGCVPAAALLATTLCAGSAAAAGAPTGIYAGMGTCPLKAAALNNANDAEVGCTVSTVSGGSFTIGSTVVQIPASSPITVAFGVYWENNGPTVSFPDGNVANIFSTVAPVGGAELTASPIDVPIPGLANFWPGVTSAITQIELAGPITNFAPLAAGENYPLFDLPIKLHLENVFLGPNCYVGSNSAPVLLQPTSGTTSPPAPNKPISGNPGTINVSPDPNGFGDAVLGFSGASLVDNSAAVPGASGCGLFGAFDGIVDALFGLPSAAGHNTVQFSNVSASIAIDSSAADLSSAIAASE